jgi:hypothetical protein
MKLSNPPLATIASPRNYDASPEVFALIAVDFLASFTPIALLSEHPICMLIAEGLGWKI